MVFPQSHPCYNWWQAVGIWLAKQTCLCVYYKGVVSGRISSGPCHPCSVHYMRNQVAMTEKSDSTKHIPSLFSIHINNIGTKTGHHVTNWGAFDKRAYINYLKHEAHINNTKKNHMIRQTKQRVSHYTDQRVNTIRETVGVFLRITRNP
jgi:hypothetical protein